MTTLEQVNRYERLLHSAKGKVQTLKNKRWIDANYKGQPTNLDPEINQIEQEITEHRQQLKNLYTQLS